MSMIALTYLFNCLQGLGINLCNEVGLSTGIIIFPDWVDINQGIISNLHSSKVRKEPAEANGFLFSFLYLSSRKREGTNIVCLTICSLGSVTWKICSCRDLGKRRCQILWWRFYSQSWLEHTHPCGWTCRTLRRAGKGHGQVIV